MEKILGEFIRQKELINQTTGRPLSKITRMNSMYNIVLNGVYGKEYTIEERLFASNLITEILKE